MPYKNIKLNDGNEIPAIAFGTGTALYGIDATEYVAQAIEAGFIHIDTAQSYKNEESVGAAINETGSSRERLYITTKFSGGDSISDNFKVSLAKLGLPYVDLYLIHHYRYVDGLLEASWREMERIKEEGFAKSIGISNFNADQLQKLLDIAKIKPTVNQINLNPYNYEANKKLLKLSDEHGIITEAYSSLAPITKSPGGPVDQPLNDIGVRLGATPAQVIFSWLKSKNIVAVTTSSKKERIQEYLEVGDLPALTEAEINAIEEAGSKGAPSNIRKYVGPGSNTIFTILAFVGLILIARYFLVRKKRSPSPNLSGGMGDRSTQKN